MSLGNDYWRKDRPSFDGGLLRPRTAVRCNKDVASSTSSRLAAACSGGSRDVTAESDDVRDDDVMSAAELAACCSAATTRSWRCCMAIAIGVNPSCVQPTEINTSDNND